MIVFLNSLYNAYIALDATLVEINPVIKTSDHKIIAADAKLTIDNNALYRHEDIASMRDYNEEDPMEVEAGSFGLNFVKLNGNVGCMVNGAGLAMATMDIIKLSGGEPANFLDVGGSANAKRVEEAFRIILKDENVKAILVNIFGGIVRCDRVANGIVDAYKNIGEIKLPIIVRLQGTNAEEAKKIIAQALFEVGIVEHEDGGKDDSDIVYYQDPEFGALRDQGMQIDLWASKKTPAELQNKIKQLDEMYRPKIDTALAPIEYREIPTAEERPAPVTKNPPAANTATALPKPKPANTNSSPSVGSPQATVKTNNSATPQNSKPAEKPKPKKFVIE